MNTNKASQHLRSARSIAVIRTDRLGDMVCTLPLVQTLTSEFPDARIHLVARSYCEPLLRCIPLSMDVHFIDTTPLHDILRTTQCDAAFFPRPVLSEVLAAVRTRVGLRIGSAYRWYSPLFNARIPEHRSTAEHHEAEYNTRMLGACMGREYDVSLVRPKVRASAHEDAASLLRSLGVRSDERLVIVHPSSGGSARDWPARSFGELARRLQESFPVRVLISGITSESAVCDAVHAACPTALNICGRCPLDVLMALMERSALLVANSTGVLHVAASLSTKVVGLYPSTPSMSAARWGPYSPTALTLNSGDFAPESDRDNVALIPCDAVFKACAEQLMSSFAP